MIGAEHAAAAAVEARSRYVPRNKEENEANISFQGHISDFAGGMRRKNYW